MTRRERIISVIEGEVSDYTPYHFDLTMMMTDCLATYYGTDAEEVEDVIGNHLLYLDFTGPDGVANGFRCKMEGMASYRDEFGVEWNIADNYNIGDKAMVGHPIISLGLQAQCQRSLL
jgi:hypothetical protein